MQDKLTTFMYLLMRDHVPTGAVVEVLKTIDDLEGDIAGQNIVFSNEHLLRMAEDYSKRLSEKCS
jgi:hypothetical protein